MKIVARLTEMKKKMGFSFRRFIAGLWGRWYRVHFWAKSLKIQYGTVAMALLCLGAYLVGLLFLSDLAAFLRGYFQAPESLNHLRTLYVSIGGALVGASAIAFSFVMFAMQVNVERLPHGLFRVFNTDGQIVAAFVGTIACSLIVASFSLMPDQTWVAATVYNSLWATLFIFLLFFHAYKRALNLINPTKQLAMLTEMTVDIFKAWVKRSHRAKPFFVSEEGEELGDGLDYEKAAYFKVNAHWIDEGLNACNYAIAFARKYVEMGDYDVAKNAHIALVNLNAAYVEAKGATFFAHNLLIDNPNVHDEFISNTLEQLRQNARQGVVRGDEKQIEQALETFTALVGVYSAIEYAGRADNKTHANLAAGYLANAVQEVIPHNMADVMMNGARLMGKAAKSLALNSDPNNVTTVTGKIAILGMAGLAKKEHSPVTSIAIEQFRDLSLFVVTNCERDIRYALKDITNYTSLLAKAYINQPSPDVFGPLLGGSLAAYYSATSSATLVGQFSNIVNALAEQPEDDAVSIRILNNIRIWSELLRSSQREVFQAALEAKSSFCIEFVMWVTSIVEAFLAASNAPACQEQVRDSIRENAFGLLNVFSMIPDDLDTIRFIENSQVTEGIFSAAFDAWQRGCNDFSMRAQDLFARWVFMAGKHNNGWAVLEHGLQGLCVLAVMQDSPEAVNNMLAKVDEYSAVVAQEKKDGVARELRREAQQLGRPEYVHSEIGSRLHQLEPEQGREILISLANQISPNTADEPIRHPLLFHGD